MLFVEELFLIFNRMLSIRAFVRRVSMEKILFSLTFFSGHFMGNGSLRLSEVLC